MLPSTETKRLEEMCLQDPGRSVPFEEGRRAQFLTPLIKGKETKQNKNHYGTLRVFFPKSFLISHFLFRLHTFLAASGLPSRPVSVIDSEFPK